jgi:hypothetical protein
MEFVMFYQWPSGARIDPIVVATVLVGIISAAFLATVL